METTRKYRQVDYAKSLYEGNYDFENEKNWFGAMLMLGIYLRDYKEMKPKQREEFLYNYMEQYNPYYNKVQHYKAIDKILSLVKNKNNKLKQIESIEIYQSEVDYIKALDIEDKYKNILFTFLCCYKIDFIKSGRTKESHIISESTMPYNKIPKLANISLTTIKPIGSTPNTSNKIAFILKKLIDKDLIFFTKSCNIGAKFIENIEYKENEEIVFHIYIFSDFGFQFEKICGNRYISQCLDCDMWFKAKPKTKLIPKRCNACTKEYDNRYDKNRSLNQRKLKKVGNNNV